MSTTCTLQYAVVCGVTASGTAKIAALGHLLDNKAQGFGFILMDEDHRLLWLQNYLNKHYYTDVI